jgi:RNA polymerase sigma-54 factor
VYVRPDIAIHRRPAPADGFEVEVLSAHAFTLRIDPTYARLAEELGRSNGNPSAEEAREQLKEHIARGKLFIRCLNQRQQTLQQIGAWLIDYQRDFLEHGERALRPITRAELAVLIGVHESTVSRAVANKYVLLPDKRVIPMSDFFDDSLAVKEVLKEIIRNEERPLSDQQLADELKKRGYGIARRTVAKYRQELNILPARLRSR